MVPSLPRAHVGRGEKEVGRAGVVHVSLPTRKWVNLDFVVLFVNKVYHLLSIGLLKKILYELLCGVFSVVESLNGF